MKPNTTTLLTLYSRIANDQRVNVWHISLFTFILMLWWKTGYSKQLKVSRKQLMTGAHFGSTTTYHKCISQLQELKYITYQPTYDSYKGSIIKVLV